LIKIEVENTTSENIIYQVALSVANPYEKSVNKADTKNGFKVLTLFNNGVCKDEIEYGDLTLATDCDTTYTQTYWYRGTWKDNIVSFWNEFSNSKNINERIYDTEGGYDIGTLVAEISVCLTLNDQSEILNSNTVQTTKVEWLLEQNCRWVEKCLTSGHV